MQMQFLCFRFQIKSGPHDFGWGALVNFHRKINEDNKDEVVYIVEVRYYVCIVAFKLPLMWGEGASFFFLKFLLLAS